MVSSIPFTYVPPGGVLSCSMLFHEPFTHGSEELSGTQIRLGPKLPSHRKIHIEVVFTPHLIFTSPFYIHIFLTVPQSGTIVHAARGRQGTRRLRC